MIHLKGKDYEGSLSEPDRVKEEFMRCQLVVVLLLMIFSSGFGLTPVGAEAGAVNLSGTWGLQYIAKRTGMPIKFTLVFKQEGEKLSGTFSGDYERWRTPRPVTGAVKGNKVVFGWEAEGNRGLIYTVAFKGTIESATSMTGTVGPPFCRDCNWTATKKKGK
jgi:hypothetical protein